MAARALNPAARIEALRRRQLRRARSFATRALTHAALIFFAMVFALPLYWMVSNAVKPNAEMFLVPPRWVPSQFLWDRFARAFTYIPFALYTWNTFYVTVYNVVATLISCTLVAYGFARLEWKGRDAVFAVLLATMMLPYQVTLIPQYIIFSRLHWVGTFKPLTVPAWFGNPFLIFLLRQFFMTVPGELTDAAKIDGSSDLGILWRIFVPLSRPALATMSVFTCMWNWNDFFWPLIYLTNQKQFTLSLGLYNFVGFVARTEWGLLLAGSTMMTILPVILFFFAQRSFIEGISLTGIRG
ncbi:MAG: carbohydrate ABC transporter permease [Anaerolineae bacterium]|nr:carbohydrate ABC transporter permease [Anaerolineae bacterium]